MTPFSPRPRIGIDARLNAYREGGIAEYTRRLIETLPTLDPERDYRVVHRARSRVTLGAAPTMQRINAFTPCHHQFERSALGAELLRWRLDLLHSPDFIPPRWGARRRIITVHDLNFLHFPQFQTADSLRYYRDQIAEAVRVADHILADSQATKDDLGNLLNVAPERVTVHMLGVNPIYRPLPPAETTAVRTRLNLPEHYILFIGTFEPRKNIVGLLRAYHALRAELPDAPALVIGGRRGWLFEDIFKLVETLHLSEHICWLEDIHTADLPAIYNGAAVLTLPSFYEGFGFPPLEAMACGVPTVVSDRGSLPEVVGQTGLLIDPHDHAALTAALNQALTDSAFRERSIVAGIARAKTFTWQHTATVVLAAYQMVLAR